MTAVAGKSGVRGGKQQRPKTPERAPGNETKRRRRPMVLAMGVMLVVLGGLATYFVVGNINQSVTVLTTSTAIARGEVIEASDLSTLDVAAGQASSALSSTRADEVIGQVATVDLPAGSLVTESTVAIEVQVPEGMSVVGVAVTQSQMPSMSLRAGDLVRIVSTPPALGDPPSGEPATMSAEVHSVRASSQADVLIVDLVVPQAQASQVAAWAATQRIALVLDGGV